MTTPVEAWLRQIATDGFAIVPAVFTPVEVDAVRTALETVFHAQVKDGVIRGDGGSVYAARNVLSMCPEAATVWRRPPLSETLEALLGPGFGLVRALFFDKPPDNSWALPWHKDLTIAVLDNRLPSRHFSKPTRKAGVPHIEASVEVLEQMVTARIHLDDVSEENGPLRVIPGSQHTGKELRLGETPPHSILVQRGDVLLMRPLLAHASNRSFPHTQRHRRILHLEFAAGAELPDGFAWYEFRCG